MIAELAPWVIALLVALIGGGAGWSQIKKHGSEKQKRKQAEADNERLKAMERQRRKPLPTDGELGDRARRVLESRR